MSNTKHLNLIKPSSGTKNWGYALNNNFETLDSYYASLTNQINALRRQMGQLGIYFYDPAYNEALTALVNNSNEVTEVYLTEKDKPENKVIIYTYNDGMINLGKLIDYSMFIFKVMKNGIEYTEKIVWNANEWYSGDIAVKLTRYDDLTNANIVTILRMQQTIGGFYQPTKYTLSEEGLPVAHFDRKNALDSVPEYKGPSIYIKPTEVNGNKVKFTYYATNPGGSSEQSLGEAATISYPQVTTEGITYTLKTDIINTGISAEDYIIVDVKFYNSGSPVICDYLIVEESDNYNILIKNKSLWYDANSLLTMAVSYAPRLA